MFFFTRLRERPFAPFFGCGILVLRLSPAGDAHPPRALAAAGVGLGPLTPDGKAAPVAKAAVGTDLHKPFDVLGALAAEVALDLALLDRFPQPHDLVLGQVFDQRVRIDLGLLEHFLRGRLTDAVDVGKADFDPFLDRDVDARDTCHRALALALKLLMARIRADHQDRTVTAD